MKNYILICCNISCTFGRRQDLSSAHIMSLPLSCTLQIGGSYSTCQLIFSRLCNAYCPVRPQQAHLIASSALLGWYLRSNATTRCRESSRDGLLLQDFEPIGSHLRQKHLYSNETFHFVILHFVRCFEFTF